jgi:circadian clock protein KaiB
MNARTFEKLVVEERGKRYALKLFVTGMSPRSTEAVAIVKRLCEEILAGNYDLEIVDLYQAPERARQEDVVAAPTLVRKAPLPERRLIGNLTNLERLRAALTPAARE